MTSGMASVFCLDIVDACKNIISALFVVGSY